MKEHNKTYYSLEELKRARDCYEGYQDGEEVYYFVGALRYACDEIERLNNILNTIQQEMENLNDTGIFSIKPKYVWQRIETLKGVEKE